jgi:succinate dehydrogenase / fumarate reductase flavoprotein subunit
MPGIESPQTFGNLCPRDIASLMTNIPGLYAIGEANFADHGANRLGANSLLQACVDGYFIAPYTIPNYLSDEVKSGPVETSHPAFAAAEEVALEQLERLLSIQGILPADYFHKTLGRIYTSGLSRSRAGLQEAIATIRTLREQFYRELNVTRGSKMNKRVGKGGSRGRLPRSGRIDVPRRVDERRILRSSLPRRTSDG